MSCGTARTCWPPSGALLAFAEGTTTPVGVDWRARLQLRMEALPTIVVDVGAVAKQPIFIDFPAVFIHFQAV